MDWNTIPFEPNLKFALELKEEFKKKYFEQHAKAKQTLERFSFSLQNIYHEHQKLLSDNIELSITNEKLVDMIKCESKEPNVPLFSMVQASEVLGASPNCNLNKVLSKISSAEIKKHDKKESSAEKENIDQFVAIYSCDFDSEVEVTSPKNYKSPPASVTNTPVKVQNSPILSKRKKRFSSKKNNSSMSNTSHSTTSSTDDKDSILEKSIIDINKEFETNIDQEPLKTIENTFLTTNTTDQDDNKRILSISKTNYANTLFLDKGKRLRQTTLSLKKPVPVIDISKIDCDKNNSVIADSKNVVNNVKNEDFKSNKNDIKKKHTRKNEFDSNVENINMSAKDDELIEVSPAHSEKSKLRNKLTLNKKLELRNSKEKISKAASKKNILKVNSFEKNLSAKSLTASNNSIINENSCVTTEKRKLEDIQRTLSDETYFSQADEDENEYESNIKYETPPKKRMLLDSFDQIPNRKEKSPDFAYKEAPVRNKNQKMQLPGWECRDCELWYRQFPDRDGEERKHVCSKHRGKYKADVLTPESFWNPNFDDLYDSSSLDD